MYHRYYHVVDVHNHLRQVGLVSMADVWLTKDWAHRHFAEGLGFWSVNILRALQHWHEDYKDLGNGDFRKRLAFEFLTLGKIPWAGESAAAGQVPRAHVQTTSTSARHGVKVLAAPQGSGTGLIVVLVMARRHLTSVHNDGPEAPKACPRIAR